ncbi:MAG: hypothetical protein HQK49_07410 [Oligoflexia bacterium]|nr:hypothetical protein [Oligoflexia bacterium]
MCGLVGLLYNNKQNNNTSDYTYAKKIVDFLLKKSQSRGKDSSGIAVKRDLLNSSITVLKDAISAEDLIKTDAYKEIWSPILSGYFKNSFAVIAHTRMETDGSFSKAENNQPIITNGVVLTHNGIIVNNKNLWREHQDLKRQYEVDSEIIACFLKKYPPPQITSVQKGLQQLYGSYTIMSLFDFSNTLLLATNTGSLYQLQIPALPNFIIWASEYHFLLELLKMLGMLENSVNINIKQVTVNQPLIFNIGENTNANTKTNTANKIITITPSKIKKINKINKDVRISNITNIKHFSALEKIVFEEYERNCQVINKLPRCSRCVLPATMPFINFDKDGVCNYCHGYNPIETRGKIALQEELNKLSFSTSKNLKNKKNSADCIVAFSGGRDSSYALHYVKKELGLNPIAYSYDWGMLTDLGRRNQARMTGALNVEHVLVSADIQKKRRYIRENWLAWLKKPHMGMIPLFMAGDKQYFYYFQKLQQDTGIDLRIYAANSLENTYFKYGLAGVKLDLKKEKRAYAIGLQKSLKLLSFYGQQYIRNPLYINSSLLDTLSAYWSSYFVPKDYLYLFKYIPWNEKVIEDTLVNEYDWEFATDTKNSWRIGDGTAAIYNYIYYTVNGFTEEDTFRSNQLRENAISREEALRMTEQGNRPRLESIIWYCDTIGLDALKTIEAINKIPKLFSLPS